MQINRRLYVEYISLFEYNDLNFVKKNGQTHSLGLNAHTYSPNWCFVVRYLILFLLLYVYELGTKGSDALRLYTVQGNKGK